jgi:hypothetical protein
MEVSMADSSITKQAVMLHNRLEIERAGKVAVNECDGKMRDYVVWWEQV